MACDGATAHHSRRMRGARARNDDREPSTRLPEERPASKDYRRSPDRHSHTFSLRLPTAYNAACAPRQCHTSQLPRGTAQASYRLTVSTALGAGRAPRVELDNGQGATPPLGFNPWTAFRTNFSQPVLLEVAQAMVSSGLAAAGYKYINLDCGWTTGFRDITTGRLQIDTKKFPDRPGFIRELHGMGLK